MSTARSACLLGLLVISAGGCGGSSSAGDAVTGRILDENGSPAANMVVRLGGRTVRTLPDGRFNVEGVTTPYDLDIAGVGNVVVSYLGLTLRTLPDLHRFGGPATPAPETATATLVGTLTGGSITAPNRIVYVVFCAERACDSTGTTAGGYSLPVTIGARTVTGKLLAIEGTYDVDGTPTGWGQLAIASATVTADQITVQDLVLSTPLASRTVAGTLTAPPDMDGIEVSYSLSDGTSGWGVHHVDMSSGGALAAVLPDLPGFTPHYNVKWIGFTPYNMSNMWGPIPETELVIDLAAPVALAAPAEAAAGVTSGTDFTWTPHAGAVHRWRVLCQGATRYVHTTGDTARLVVLDGYPVPAGETCTWAVFTYEPFASMDSFVSHDWASYPFGAPTYTASERRSFQLQ